MRPRFLPRNEVRQTAGAGRGARWQLGDKQIAGTCVGESRKCVEPVEHGVGRRHVDGAGVAGVVHANAQMRTKGPGGGDGQMQRSTRAGVNPDRGGGGDAGGARARGGGRTVGRKTVGIAEAASRRGRAWAIGGDVPG